MKPYFKFTAIFVLFTFFLVSCQEEETIINNPTNDEVIEPSSSLANLMRSTVAFNGSLDNILDASSCIGVNLPVTVTVNGTTITIETLDDLDLIEAIYNAFDDDEDVLEFLFPITITLNDYTEITIEDADELATFVNACTDEPDVIECVDFVYPITFSIYNTDFQVVDTIEIHSDFALYVFLENLETGSQGTVLASINFPISLVYANGETIEVTNNQELEEAINAADEDCNYTECTEEQIDASLMECHWTIAAHNGNDDYLGFDFYFNENNHLQIVYGTGALTVSGNWSTSMTDGHVVITISELTDFSALEGHWLVETCENDRLVLTQETGSGAVEMVLEQDCAVQTNPFNCFGNVTVTVCDDDHDGFAIFDLETQVLGTIICQENFTATFHVTYSDAETGVNAIAQPNAFVNMTNPQTVYLRVEADNGDFEIFEIELVLENCNPSGCTEQDVDAYLQECIWNVVNFNGDDHLTMYSFEFTSNTNVVITGGGLTINATWSTSQSANGTIVEFNNVAGPDIQAVTGNWLVVECREDRLQLESLNSTDTMVMERDCHACDNPGTLTNDLIIYMPFGGEVKDLISGETVDGFTFLTEDRAGNATCAVSFDGSENFSIPVTAQNQLVQGDNFSVSIWFKMQNTDVGNFETIFQKGSVNSEGFQLAVYDLNTPLVSDTTNGYGLWDNDWNQEVDVQWDNTDWHHLVITRDSNNTIRLYRDGQLRNIDENSNFNIDTDPLNHYLIGQFFTGHLDDLRVYKRTLSPNDVGDLYNLEADCYTCL